MSELIDQIYEYSRANYVPIIDDDSKEILLNLVREINPKHILEIGTAVGYSSSLMLECCDGDIDTIEIDEDRRNLAMKLWKDKKLEDRVHSYLGNVDEILEDVIKGKEYDFVFIDGPKSRYLDHLIKCKDNVAPHGVIFADDILFFGMVKGDEHVPHKHRTIVRHLREFLSYLENSTEFETNILDTGNGIAIITKK